ncbi:MAG: chorismate mutase [Clostridia bacterium]|nr:chorismate mutase [Clostridia bacterium]
MKTADECLNIEEIRSEIDRIDMRIISEISSRYKYVKAAARYKKDEESVKATDRVKKMMEARRQWALEEGLDPDVIEKLFTCLVNYFIGEELKQIR